MGLNSGLDGVIEILPFVFCFGPLRMLSIVSSHVLLNLPSLLHVQIMEDSLVPSKLVFNLTLVMISNPLEEGWIIQRLTLA